MGYSPWGRKELDITDRLNKYFVGHKRGFGWGLSLAF